MEMIQPQSYLQEFLCRKYTLFCSSFIRIPSVIHVKIAYKRYLRKVLQLSYSLCIFAHDQKDSVQ